MRIFRYVVRYDAGSAPRPYDGYCSLAICKPRIRKAARVGDWIIGFRSRCPGDVIYVMRVEEVLAFPEYWADERFHNRRPGASSKPDNIYRPGPSGTLEQVPNPVHGLGEAATDLGGRNALLSKTFWYFGRNSPAISTDLIHLVHTGIGHSVDRNRRPDDLEYLTTWLGAWGTGRHGDPIGR